MLLHLVKYGRLEHLEAFMERGSIQLGTLHGYDEASHGPKIGDDSEGLSHTIVDDRNIADAIKAGFPIPSIAGIPAFLHPGSQGNVVHIRNVSFNYIVFCMSSILSAELCRDFGQDYDCALYITRPFVFLHEVSRAFEESGTFPEARFRHVSEIIYTDRNLGVAGLSPDTLEVFIKEPRYQNQREVRAIWSSEQADQIPSGYYRFDAPRAIPCCQIIPIEDMPS